MLVGMPDPSDPQASKKAAFDDMPWVTAGRAVPQEDAPDESYLNYLKDTLGSDLRRQRFFDVTGGTRGPGLTGALGAHGRAISTGQELVSAGINPMSSRTPEGFSKAFRGHFGDRRNVEGLFGSSMEPTEALATLGPLGVLTASREAGDPRSWAKAFGTGARTPEEQQRIRRRLHAAMSLHATKQALKELWNTSRLGEVFGKTPFDAVSRYPQAHKSWEVGPEGWQAKPMEASQIPVLDPKYFPDNEEAARVAAKYGCFDKYARDLNGDWPTAKDPGDKEPHLYHTVKKDGTVVGMVKVKPHIDGFQISNLWIRPESRSNGVGTGLMKRVIKYYGDKKLYLTAEIFDNSPITQDELEAWYKKFGFVGSHEGKMTRPAQVKTAAEDTRPYRNRVEVFAVDDPKVPKVYGGKFKTGGFGVFGGGTDGDALEEAAKREFLQETGYKLTGVVKIPVDPVTVEWSKPYKSAKQAERAKTYRGTRTWYFYGVIDGEKTEKAEGEDGQSPLTDVGFYTIDTALKLLAAATTENTELLPQIEARKRALFFVLAKAYGIGLTKIAADVPTWAKKNPKLMRALAKKLKKTAGSRDTAMTHADAGATILLEILGRQEPKKAPRRHPRRTRNLREVLAKQAAMKLAAPLGRLTSWAARAAKNIRPITTGPATSTLREAPGNGWQRAVEGMRRAPTVPELRTTRGSFAHPVQPMSPGLRQEFAVSNRILQDISDRAAARPVGQGTLEFWQRAMNPSRVRLPTPRALQVHGMRLGNQRRMSQATAQAAQMRRLAVGAGGAGALVAGGAAASGIPAMPQRSPQGQHWAGPSENSPAATNIT